MTNKLYIIYYVYNIVNVCKNMGENCKKMSSILWISYGYVMGIIW